MSDLETETKIKSVAEGFELMGFKLMADIVRASKGLDLEGYAEMCRQAAERKGEIFIAEKMRMI
ncbi:MAG TPA: hypothetical protein VGW78_07605 [Candidatus Babeliales bacterium]|jgi:hypothetical protein|nr:hypothetical protein [Candidatus Babeliales bacterium]